MRPIYHALPKDKDGGLDQHGWHVNGFDPEGELWNATTATEMLKERVPLHVQELVGKKLRRRRAQLKEVAVPAATLDDLVHRRQGWVSPFLFVAVMERNRKHCNGELREVSVAHGG